MPWHLLFKMVGTYDQNFSVLKAKRFDAVSSDHLIIWKNKSFFRIKGLKVWCCFI